jgi:uncharacterized protein YndB with AHSA1/START domain
MNKLSVQTATSHTLSITAMEEASRRKERTAGIEHLFLALVLSEQRAGQLLRSLGITLETARDAIERQHEEQLNSLGIRTESPQPGRITFHETGAVDWHPRALEIIKNSARDGKRGDAAAILRELVVEPSGLIEAVLGRLGTTPATVIARLDEAERHAHDAVGGTEADSLSGTRECFVPAPIDRVWELLADPARMPEWEPGTGWIEAPPAVVSVGSTWTAHAVTEHPDGRPSRVKAQHRSARVETTAWQEGLLGEWRFTWPDAPKANARVIRIELEPAAGGSHLHITTVWVHRGRRRNVLRAAAGRVLRPVHHFAIWLQLSQLAAAISRVFR